MLAGSLRRLATALRTANGSPAGHGTSAGAAGFTCSASSAAAAAAAGAEAAAVAAGGAWRPFHHHHLRRSRAYAGVAAGAGCSRKELRRTVSVVHKAVADGLKLANAWHARSVASVAEELMCRHDQDDARARPGASKRYGTRGLSGELLHNAVCNMMVQQQQQHQQQRQDRRWYSHVPPSAPPSSSSSAPPGGSTGSGPSPRLRQEDRDTLPDPSSQNWWAALVGILQSSTNVASAGASGIGEQRALPRADPELQSRHGPVQNDVDESRQPSPMPAGTSSTVKAAFIGNMAITALKFAVWMRTGSSAMFAEAMHTLVDCGNQAFLLLGLSQSSMVADKLHPYGYGRAAFFWALVSALGMFWMGGGISFFHGLQALMAGDSNVQVLPETWMVLIMSFMIDGLVLTKAVGELKRRIPPGMTMFQYLQGMHDPFLWAVLLEDASACLGVLVAGAGIGMTKVMGDPVYDCIASMTIGGMLAGIAVFLVSKNHKFLIGQAVDKAIIKDINNIILSRPGVERVYAVQSQWLGPTTFSYKAEVDFDGANLAAQLYSSYESEFLESKSLKDDLPILLGCYAEDITRLVEKEVKLCEALIRAKYPNATYIELEPDSYYTFRKKLDDMEEPSMKDVNRTMFMSQLQSIMKAKSSKVADVKTPEV